MNLAEGELHFTKVGNDRFSYYLAKRDKVTEFGLSLDSPDSFFVGWMTGLNVDQFLTHACSLIEAVSTLKPDIRPMETGNPITVVTISPDQADEDGVVRGVVSAPGSYSGFNYNNIIINRGRGYPVYADLDFDNLGWPLNRRDINKAIELGLGKSGDRFQVEDDDFIRINAEFCTVSFNGEPSLFSYWSHVPAVEALVKTYGDTAINPSLANQFGEVVNIFTSPRFAQYLISR